ncbi:O-antigen polymerase [Parvibaculum lavamentivorans DS-1]|uniref:O-antigen polymerase n=1 Tax=Parvibaculum lavamentivorans (strain DS-1 / DSM 13023 / NCIMB 13966) TaxID=402881 RepID=A7HUF0_PARL1|nr:O-antigen ligase family protein [Parvibaculum lavamentivorans]ABS63533.1 O-antigen polymerase [Parvibaculum lavamentivorans DS-1]
MLNFLIPVSAVTLFLATKMSLGIIQLRPFDILVAFILLLVAIQPRLFMRARLDLGFLILLPFFIVHTLSAFGYYTGNGIRELFQVTLILGFAFVLNAVGDRLDYKLMGKILLIGLIGVMIYNIGWHISQGQWSGWKRLNDPKAAFTFLPMLLSVFILFAPDARRRLYWALWIVVGIAVFLSGERKALLAFGIITVALLSRGRFVAAIPVLAAGIFALSILATLVDDPYITRQVNTLLEPTTTDISLSAMAEGQMPTSLSNAAREFSFEQVKRMSSENPLFGIGTNAYTDIMRREFAFLPSFLLVSIHGEFLRIIVENGIVGLAFYILIWVVALLRNLKVAHHLQLNRRITQAQARILPILLLLPPAFYVGFEATGTRVFMATILASMAPSLVFWAVSQRARPAASTRRVQTGIEESTATS